MSFPASDNLLKQFMIIVYLEVYSECTSSRWSHLFSSRA